MTGPSLRHGPGTERLTENLEKPLLDDREYRVIRLPNKLEVLLVQDSDTDRAAAAMDVNVGSLADPPEMQGMAHAVEHTLFMGTGKFPAENDYNAYISRCNGQGNAFTSMTSTNYYFELFAQSTPKISRESEKASEEECSQNEKSAPLYGALDRFSQFFIQPLFQESTLDRELHAIDSESKKHLQSDNWRLMQLDKSLSNQRHPYSFFSTGNYQVLHDQPLQRGVDIRREFMNFYQTHYSANRMKLCVLGRESLDVLQSWVEELFSDIINLDLKDLKWNVPLQTETELCTQIFAKSVMDQRLLTISFPYPDEREFYASQPSQYIGHLVGHEGSGSLLAYLKSKVWADSLAAGIRPVCPGHSFFLIKIQLTSDGIEHYRRIIILVFQYIAMLKEHPPQRWIFEEQRTLAEMRFKFRPKILVSKAVSDLSSAMQKPYPRTRLISGPCLLREFKPDLIKSGLDALRPDNFRFTIASRDFPGNWNLKELWYGTAYSYEKIPIDFMDEIKLNFDDRTTRPSALSFPSPNEFLPHRLEVEKFHVLEPLLEPHLIRHDENVRLWFKEDDCFWVPKANLEVLLRTPLANATPLTAAMTMLYTELITDSLSECSYNAAIAGLSYSITRRHNGLQISVGGYSDKMLVLLERVIFSMRDLEVDQARFEIIKERLLRACRNFDYQEPYRQISSYRTWLGTPNNWANHQLLAELHSITAEDVRFFFPRVLRQVHIETLAHGNLSREDAFQSANMVETALQPISFPSSQWDPPRNLMIPPGTDAIYEHTLQNPNNKNNCVDYTIQIGDAQDRKLQAKLLLFAQVVDEPLFNTLRTKEQLGYVCSGRPIWNGTQSTYRILVQSEKECAYVETRIDAFLVGFKERIMNMSQSEFESHKTSAMKKRLQKLQNLNQETGRLWHHISNGTFDFKIIYRDAEHIQPLAKEDLLEFIAVNISPESAVRAKSSIHLIAATVDRMPSDAEFAQQSKKHAELDLQDGKAHSHDANLHGRDGDRHRIFIRDVESFKASLSLTAASRVMKPISEFQDSGDLSKS